MDGDRAVPRGGRRVLVDRAERDRPRAGAVRARRARARHRRRRARVRPSAGRVPLRAARRAPPPRVGEDDRAALALRDRRRDPARGAQGLGRRGARGDRGEDRPRGGLPPHPRRDVDRPAARLATRAARGSTRRSTSCGRTRSACSTTSCVPSSSPRRGEARPRAARRRAGPARPPRGGARRAARGDDDRAPLRPRGSALVSDAGSDSVGHLLCSRDDVWHALAEIPDPEIPVISIVDLGVVRDVRVDGEHVHVDFTPTFMGCPALDVMRPQMEEGSAGSVASRRSSRARRLVVDRPDQRGGPREAPGRGFAPPTPRAPSRRRSSSSSAARSAAPGAARPTRSSRTCSARPRAARSATATPAASRSSSSRRSDG